jgi:hypothetical protein
MKKLGKSVNAKAKSQANTEASLSNQEAVTSKCVSARACRRASSQAIG